MSPPYLPAKSPPTKNLDFGTFLDPPFLAYFLACLFSGLFDVFHGFGLPFGLPFGIIFHTFGMPFSSLDFASIPSRFLIVFYLSETTFFTIKQVVLGVSAFFGNI